MRQGIAWLELLGEINQSKYNSLQKTNMKRVINADNSFLFFINFGGNMSTYHNATG